MVDGDGIILARLQDDYGRDWYIGRTYDQNGRPNWWSAKRKRDLTRVEEERGLSRTLYGDTAGLLRDELDKQAAIAVRLTADAAGCATGHASWNPASL